jgi:hypothetical protein
MLLETQETLPPEPQRPEVSENEPVFLDPQKAVDAVVHAHSLMSAGAVRDHLDMHRAAWDRHTPLLRRRDLVPQRIVYTASVASALSIPVVSPLPAVGVGLFQAGRALYDKSQRAPALQKEVDAAREAYTSVQSTLQESLGGLQLELWKDHPRDALVLEIAEGETEEDNKEIVERLRFLEDCLAATGERSRVSGYILAPATASATGTDDPEVPASAIFHSLGKQDVRVRFAAPRVFVESLQENPAASLADDTRAYLMDVISRHEPNHPLLKGLREGTELHALRQLAQHCLEERLSDVRRPDYRLHGHQARSRSTVTVLPNMIMRHLPEGGIEIVPHGGFRLDPKTDAQKSAEQLLTAAEYTIFKGDTLPVAVIGTEHAIQPLAQKETTYESRRGRKLSRSTDDGLWPAETYTIHEASVSKKQRRYRRAAAVILLALANARAFEINDAARDNYDYWSITQLGITDAEAAAASHLTGVLDTYEHAFNPLNYRKPVEAANTPADEFKELFKYLPGGSAEGQGGDAGMPGGPNVPQWYISASRGTNVAGYWDVNRYEGLSLNQETRSLEWKSWVDSQPEAVSKEIAEAVTVSQQRPLVQPGGLITVEGSLRMNGQSYTALDGAVWQAIHVPVLHGHHVTYADAVLKEHGKSLLYIPEIRAYRDETGTTLYIRMKGAAEPDQGDDRYANLMYQLSPDTTLKTPVAAPRFLYNPGYFFLKDIRDTLKSASFSADATKELFRGVEYSLNPVDGKDKNGNGMYDAADLFEETFELGTANCFTANSLLALLSPETVAPISGFLLSPEAIAKDSAAQSGNRVKTFLSTHDKHFYTVDRQGAIIDATPPLTDPGSVGDYFVHPAFDEGNSGPYIDQNASGTQSLRLRRRYETDHKADIRVLQGAGLLVAGGTLLGSGLYLEFARRRQRERRLLDMKDPRSFAAGALAYVVGYGGEVFTIRPLTPADVAIDPKVDITDGLARLDPRTLKKSFRTQVQLTNRSDLSHFGLIQEQLRTGRPVRTGGIIDAGTAKAALRTAAAARKQATKQQSPLNTNRPVAATAKKASFVHTWQKARRQNIWKPRK